MAISDVRRAGADPAVEGDADELGFVPDRGRRYTAAEVRALNAANPRWWPRYECADGRLLVSPAPRFTHQTVVERLFVALAGYCDAHFADGVARLGPADISWGRRGTTLSPDVFVVPRAMGRAAAARRSSASGWREIRHLLLVAEVVSSRTAGYDRGDKRLVYQREGVPLYWILDPEAGVSEEWTPGVREARVERERLVWHPEAAAVPFELALAHLFRPL